MVFWVCAFFCFVFCIIASATQFYTLSLHDALPIFGATAYSSSRHAGNSPCSLSACATSASAAERQSRSEEHTSELQSRFDLVCRLLLEKKNNYQNLMIG